MIQRFACTVRLRGRGAKGVRSISTFGKPVASKKNPGIAKRWKYDHASSYNLQDILDAAKQIGNVNEILLIGMDTFLRSTMLKGQSHVALLAEKIGLLGLAVDVKEAYAVARIWLTNIESAKKIGIEPPTIEQLVAGRTKQVAELKAKGLWLAQPAIVEAQEEISSPEVEEEEEEEEEEDEESEDEDSDEVVTE